MGSHRYIDPYQRIVRNAKRNKGVYLTDWEVRELATHKAIQEGSNRADDFDSDKDLKPGSKLA